MMKRDNESMIRELFLFIVALIPLLYTIFSYGNLPDMIPIHWTNSGEVDDWTAKGIGYLLMMSLPVFMNILLLFAPKLDAQRAEAMMKSDIYFMVRVGIIGILAAILTVSVYAALGHDVPMATIVALVMGIVFLMIAQYVPKIPYNYFISFRNPWTLYNKTIWKKTHVFAGRIFFLVGVYMLLSPQIFPEENIVSQFMWIFLIFLCCFSPTFYSMYLYRKEVGTTRKK